MALAEWPIDHHCWNFAMPMPNLELLLSPLGEASPAGDNLEYEPEFMELERMASPVAERVIGDSVKEAREPDWDKVRIHALEILERSRDLRVAIYLTCALTRIEGLAGWALGLRLLRGLLEKFWDEAYPRLDAEDDNDPTARANAISAIADVAGALGYFRAAPVVASSRLGHFSLRDLRLANGSLKLDSVESPSMVDIEACCLDCAEDDLREAHRLAGEAVEHASAISDLLSEGLGLASPDLALLLDDVRMLHGFLDGQSTRRWPAVDDPAGSSAGAAPAPVTTSAGPAAGEGRIESPQDVSRMLEKICAYYARAEPSSPVPLLLRRAQRLVGMNFVDLLRDLAPGGLNELQVVSGEPESDDD